MGAVLGAHCPLPIRLGGDELSGWTAAQHARVCADLAAASRTLPFAVLTISRGGTSGDSPVIVRNNSRSLSVPVVAGNNPGDEVTITWDWAPLDLTGKETALKILAGHAYHHVSEFADVAITAPNQITVTLTGESNALTFSVKVFAQFGTLPSIDDYGGELDKRDAEREATPYSWLQYQELEQSMGSGYGTKRTGMVHARKLALSRALAACYRSEERLRANARPDTADAMLEDWAKSVDVPIPFGEPRSKTRKFVSVMFAAESGQNIPALERACSHLLGPAFLGIRTFDVDDPPGVWPVSWDLGGGVWASTRCKFLVDVRAPLIVGDPAFRELVEVRLMRMLDRLAPSHSWFNWTILEGGGFYLDVSPLDYTGL